MKVLEPNVVAVEALEPGTLIYCPALGDGKLCVAASYEGQDGAATLLVALSDPNDSDAAASLSEPFEVAHVSGPVVEVEGYVAKAVLSTALGEYRRGEAAAISAGGALYAVVRGRHQHMAQFLCLSSGRLTSTLGARRLGFQSWRIVAEDDVEDVLWTSGSAASAS